MMRNRHEPEASCNLAALASGLCVSVADSQRAFDVMEKMCLRLGHDTPLRGSPLHLAGSQTRGTAISFRGVSDIDGYALLDFSKLPPGLYRNPKKIIERWLATMAALQCTELIRGYSNCLSITSEKVAMDILPALVDARGFLKIPDAQGEEWIRSDPEALQKIVSDAERRSGGQFMAIVRILKLWNIVWNQPLRNYHLECMVLACFLKRGAYRGLWDAFLSILLEMPKLLEAPCYDPAVGDRLDFYLGMQTAVTRRLQAFTMAAQCQMLARRISRTTLDGGSVGPEDAIALFNAQNVFKS